MTNGYRSQVIDDSCDWVCPVFVSRLQLVRVLPRDQRCGGAGQGAWQQPPAVAATGAEDRLRQRRVGWNLSATGPQTESSSDGVRRIGKERCHQNTDSYPSTLRGHWCPGGVGTIASPIPGQFRGGGIGESRPRQSGSPTAMSREVVDCRSDDRSLLHRLPQVRGYAPYIKKKELDDTEDKTTSEKATQEEDRWNCPCKGVKNKQGFGDSKKEATLYVRDSAGPRRLDFIQVIFDTLRQNPVSRL